MLTSISVMHYLDLQPCLNFLQTQILLDYSPVQLMKAMKNSVEMEGMKQANVSIKTFCPMNFQKAYNVRKISIHKSLGSVCTKIMCLTALVNKAVARSPLSKQN